MQISAAAMLAASGGSGGGGWSARAPPPSVPSRHHRLTWGLGHSGGSMRITVNVEIAPEEVPMATELLAVLR